ncbi:hypothetical protein ACIRYZ_44355 [Kitasatospora sp. NPDC101155]|uniref:DUF7586 domain-containing protein n=1 Tax=Kitasatospora sp. NPDC101155 TaxID=3364097 RepID=UPI0037FF390F
MALTGPWCWGASAVAPHLRAGRVLELTALGGAARTSRFRPEPDGTWTGLDGYCAGEPLRVVHRADGTVDHLDQAGFLCTRTPYDRQPRCRAVAAALGPAARTDTHS